MAAQRKLILRNGLSPGDIVTLTAAVRDLHRSHPGRFLTDVRTPCPALWAHNPCITALKESDEGVETIPCEYPLIHRSNTAPYHMIHGFRLFLQEKLGVPIEPRAFKGDIHLSAEEKGWLSQVEEIEGAGARFWIVVSGGKRDYTAKWWDPDRAQRVVDHFQGRIRFVQCGEAGHHHPRLHGVLDLVGRTDLRQLVRLMYHADGVICPVTMFMHLAAAVETRSGRPANRPCVVIAGGREPAHWESYPHHRFLHTMGALPCCQNGGCWKSRVEPLGDGDAKDRSLCERPVALPGGRKLPRCLDMIAAEDVIRAVEQYLTFETCAQAPRAKVPVPRTAAHGAASAQDIADTAFSRSGDQGLPKRDLFQTGGMSMNQTITARDMEGLAATLRQAKTSGRLAKPLFDALHNRFHAQDHAGVPWSVGVLSGKWHTVKDGQWVPAAAVPPALFMDEAVVREIASLAPPKPAPAPAEAKPAKPADARFCASCGARQSAAGRFCTQCGARAN